MIRTGHTASGLACHYAWLAVHLPAVDLTDYGKSRQPRFIASSIFKPGSILKAMLEMFCFMFQTFNRLALPAVDSDLHGLNHRHRLYAASTGLPHGPRFTLLSSAADSAEVMTSSHLHLVSKPPSF